MDTRNWNSPCRDCTNMFVVHVHTCSKTGTCLHNKDIIIWTAPMSILFSLYYTIILFSLHGVHSQHLWWQYVLYVRVKFTWLQLTDKRAIKTIILCFLYIGEFYELVSAHVLSLSKHLFGYFSSPKHSKLLESIPGPTASIYLFSPLPFFLLLKVITIVLLQIHCHHHRVWSYVRALWVCRCHPWYIHTYVVIHTYQRVGRLSM